MTAVPRRVCVVGLDHMHAGDQVGVIRDIDGARLAGVWDASPERLARFGEELAIEAGELFPDLDEMLDRAAPDVAVVCSTTAAHRGVTERLTARGIHVLLEKPFGPNLEDVAAMIAAAERAGVLLGVNWPLAWYPSHRTAHRLIADGAIGAVTEVHYYDGNRGPLFHSHGKRVIDDMTARALKDGSWWYDPEQGGGSLRDYLGYGATLATWFRGGELPDVVVAVAHSAAGDRVDEQSVTVGLYPSGLSTFQTRWGTFTDPWTEQPQPRCGFVLVGQSGTLSSWDYDEFVTLQTQQQPSSTRVPVDAIPAHEGSGLGNLLHCLDRGSRLYGPLSSGTSRDGQRIVEAAAVSAREGRAVRLGELE
ncbi:MAG: glucose-fructose oxidoreductase [Naasia sp.]|nr:glucose-fructose oxidoreductase [Naasia sp.]